MKIRLFLTILLTFAAMNIYAQESAEIVAKMMGGLRADNSKSITIPGKKGAIRIYFESLKTTPYASELIHIDYNDKVSPFQAGSNFVITQDDKLIFGRYDDKIYARGYVDKNNEYVSIKHNNYVYEYSRDNIKIYDSKEQILTGKEIIYDKNKASFMVYDKNKLLKTKAVGN